MFLLDTNVVSELRKASPDRRVTAFLEAHPRRAFHVSDVTLAEIRFGVENVTEARRRNEMRAWLNESLRPYFAGRILSADEEAWFHWKSWQVTGRRMRYNFPQPDLVIAAIALRHDLTVATRDTEPFERAKVAFVNPWKHGIG